MIPLRQVLKQYEAKRAAAQHGDRVLRESSTLRVTDDVWSDVASKLELGFRSSEAGPLVYGELPSGAELELGLFETRDSDVYCTVATVKGPAGARREGSLAVRPLDAAARVLRLAVKQPELGEAIGARYFVRARPLALAGELLGERAREALVTLADRAPRLLWDRDSTILALEGVELVHERLELVVRALDEIAARGRAT